ncbi:MAG: leucine/isoleucine/valine transporter permease subunit [Chloroflexi bacterium]|nr:leucine/isoleucine/valine transporter permease subunit [Chloroflexota bacterium]
MTAKVQTGQLSSFSNKTLAFDWKGLLRIGLIGGLMAVLVSIIGMVETFHGRDIVGGVITMGQTVLAGAIFVSSSIAASRNSSHSRLSQILGAVVSGLLATATLGILIWFSQLVNLRPIFVNISPSLIRILTFEKDLPGQLVPALGLLLAYGFVIGLFAGLLYVAPTKMRKAVTSGIIWVLVIGLLGELLRTLIVGKPIEESVSWILGTRNQKGVSVIGAAVIFSLVAAFSTLSQMFGGRLGSQVQARKAALPVNAQRGLNATLLLVIFLILWQLPQLFGIYLSDVANTVGLYILMGLGLNIVVGYAGLLDLGYVAFFALGAYTMAVATSTAVGAGRGLILFSLGLTFWEALPIAVGVACLAGIILGIPVLKMRGDYLAIVTLGFGEIIRILAFSDFLKPYIGGAQGIVKIAPIMVAGQNLTRPTELFHVVLIICAIVAFIAWRLRDSRVGRAWKAIREDEDVASAMGINLVTSKLLAFASGAAFSGFAGAIFATKLSSIIPGSFGLLVSINILALIIVGGMGSLPGVLVGALALVALPELLREFSEFRLLVFGAVLVGMMIYKPEGLLPEETRKLELHEPEPGELQP